ncbi:MAG: tetratricopeptide repeat protein [Alphaproteobacteria bacterium]|nr:tetratricopeptide repeat protein [Alphaproteobacteria bacterium]
MRLRQSILAIATVVALLLPHGGLQATEAEDRAKFDYCLPKAEAGDAACQGWLGIVYSMGRGVPQDYAQAVSWFRKAAEQGNAVAQSGLGVSYAVGLGVPQDYSQAVSWFRKAAEQGDVNAQYSLGLVYGEGQGVPTNYFNAYILSALAAVRGESNFVKLRDFTQSALTPADLAAAQALVSQWKVGTKLPLR